MGDNTLITKLDGDTISVNDVNQYKTAMNQDIVPRSTSGVATNEAGSFGTTVYRWLSGWVKTLNIGTPANNNIIDEDGTGLRLKSDSGIQIDINGTPIGSGIDSNGISRNMLAQANYQLSASCGVYNLTGTTAETDVTNLSVTITTTGKPVMIGLCADQSGGYNQVLASGYIFNVRYYRDSTIMLQTDIAPAGYWGDGMPYVFDAPTAGTYIYKMTVQLSNSAGGANVTRLKLFAYEL